MNKNKKFKVTVISIMSILILGIAIYTLFNIYFPPLEMQTISTDIPAIEFPGIMQP